MYVYIMNLVSWPVILYVNYREPLWVHKRGSTEVREQIACLNLHLQDALCCHDKDI